MEKQKTVLVAATKNDSRMWLYNPYAGNATGRLMGREYPVIRLSVDVENLVGLAKFLAENLGATINHRSAKVVCYSGETEADAFRREYASGTYNGAPVENYIRAYDMERKPALIEDWLFPIATPEETGEEYFDRAAREMLKAGVEMVKITAPPAYKRKIYFCGTSDEMTADNARVRA